MKMRGDNTKDRCYGCFGASFGDCDECRVNNDLIRRSDAIEALVSTSEIKGQAYRVLMEKLKAIPRQ